MLSIRTCIGLLRLARGYTAFGKQWSTLHPSVDAHPGYCDMQQPQPSWMLFESQHSYFGSTIPSRHEWYARHHVHIRHAAVQHANYNAAPQGDGAYTDLEKERNLAISLAEPTTHCKFTRPYHTC